MSQKTKNIPKLRFPEFVDDGEWEEKELGKLGKFLGGGTPNKSIDEYWHGTIPWISSSDINEDDLKTISITRFINEKSVLESATKIIPKGSVLFVSRVGTGKLAINSIDLCTSQDFTNFISTQICNYFLGYYFLANKSALTSLDQGTSIKGFSKSDLEKFKLTYPKKEEEQQKIADCLSSIDSLILAQSQKVELLKEHKKGLLQQLFPQEGESVPRLRFPEFANSGEWEERELNKLGNTYNGLSGKTAQDFGYGNSNYITYKNIFDNSKINISIFENVNIETNEKQNLVKFGDIFFTISSETREETGMSSVLLEDTKNTYLNSFCFGYRLNNFDILSPYFARFYFRATMLRNKISRLAQGSTRFNLSKEKVMQINISLPSLPEQQKIADCLSSLDELITSSTKKVELLKEHKKGLMQQLFPSNEE